MCGILDQRNATIVIYSLKPFIIQYIYHNTVIDIVKYCFVVVSLENCITNFQKETTLVSKELFIMNNIILRRDVYHLIK